MLYKIKHWHYNVILTVLLYTFWFIALVCMCRFTLASLQHHYFNTNGPIYEVFKIMIVYAMFHNISGSCIGDE